MMTKGHYTSEPFDVLLHTDLDGNQQTEERTTTVSVSIVGNDVSGYVLHTSDDADGPSDDLGPDSYPTQEAAAAAMSTLVLKRPDGWIEIL